MAEKDIVVDNLTISYKGVFDLQDTIGQLHDHLRSKGYRLHEKKSEQLVREDDQTFYYDLRASKRKTNYMGLRIFTKVIVENLTETMVELDGFPRKVQQGDLQILFDAYIHTDWQARWNQNFYTTFLKFFINQFVWPIDQEGAFRGEVAGDTKGVYAEVRSFLNLYKYKLNQNQTEKPTQLP